MDTSTKHKKLWWWLGGTVVLILVGGLVLYIWFIGQLNSALRNSVSLNSDRAPSPGALGRVVLALSGWPEEKTWLVLFQNSAELRPTGGFIGSFAIVKTASGKIKQLEVHDSYALDQPSETTDRPATPEPLKRWNATSRWYFRDANWDVDFPTSVNRLLQFFYEEQAVGGKIYADHIDGVIAITPSVVERLLNITGPVTIDERTFNSDSFHTDLQLYVERDYAADNIPREDRKAIIETIARQLIKKFISLEGGGVAALNNIFLASLQDRSIVLWFEDSEAQKVVSAAGWDGRVRSTDGDFIMLVDANLASLKTDPFVRRAVHYQVLETEDGLMARLDIDYRHEGTFSFTTTRYRSFTRVLVPAGSKLLRVEGAELGDRATSVGPVFEQTEADKNSFGAFISVEPGQSHRLSFVYQLPSHLLDQLKANTYTLLAQRQAGTQNYPLIVDITARRPIVPKILTESVEQLGSQRVRFTGTLAKDQYIEIK